MKKNPYITEELEFLAETAEKFAQKYIAPGFLERDQSRIFDRDLVKKMGEMGFIAPELPEQYGGQGIGRLAAGIIHEAIAKADLSFSYINLLASLNGQILAEHGQPEVVEPWLKKLTAGEAIFSIALTEPRGGSDAANLRLKIERDGDEYVINGEKTSISAADQADASVVFGRTGANENGAHGVTALLVPMNLPGISTTRFDCHGQRAIGRGSIFFDNVRVPVNHRLGDENKGFVQVMQGFDFSRALIGLQVLAVARVSLDEAWEYAAQREAFGQPLTAFQGVSHPLAEYETQVEAARLLCLQTLWLKDNHLPHTSEAGMCKWWGPKLAYDVIHQCLLTFGHAGYDRGVMEQRMRDVLGFQIGDGTAQIMKTIIARHKAGRKAVPA
ncbi:cyclohexanecarboxyl-CoA dehydrogenase [Acinetobacter radioresistens DSM 6976 = NBRC 102413 = CIP 103788]|jgi:cyclohexanecarboxyl-CoA dehydrogenase|uniref:cyclohexanecarboxyl-CoA dehydrogenase n=1 Tax=Acinetobacter TaxID=469 RepID=UPI00028D3CEA|nr:MULTISPECIES: cyclohexanecarboxyl-CoA dehydrogenase [Acinetobacter]ENV87347.1 cyclohexanecarboxyl-CoA dehydrogenase [Acinetobacter radioresistens DSM 6976 = NBRC 102413 = CIP 103788]EXC31899.1 cyclohexanecarboxyl-CoA dehydrogenase [Acinetobacter sp. 869535]MCU4518425.1 cyclohexanecarboxyl-CoA dehydrogenase [Acinetobacter radioresistens]PKD85766.1 cyclohexanecarboxyl-CoA dehydrogenase [Acinetobacter radioresistens]RSO64192.1 cyclohexanecarboxyl-CoA dehydrogenase [Acinetobacter radioresistens